VVKSSTGTKSEPSEAALEGRLANRVKKKKGVILKLPALWYTGIPDRLILLPQARVIFVELKRKGKKARKNQIRWIKLLRSLGFKAMVVAGTEQLNKFMDKYL
jgi:VRR-NUC domain